MHLERTQPETVQPPFADESAFISLAIRSADPLPQLRVAVTDADFLKSERFFLEKWQHTLVDTPERINYMTAWYRSLSLGFGTPVPDYFKSLQIEAIDLSNDHKQLAGHAVTFEERPNTMNRLRKTDGPLQIPADFDYPDLIDPACGCCSASMRAEQHARNDSLYPILLDYLYGRFQVIPNRFAWVPGGCMILPFHHDVLSDRMLDLQGNSSERPAGKTFGHVITDRYLESLFQASNLYDLVVFQNHPLSGMSQPWHVHAHGIPAEFPKAQVIKSLADIVERPEDQVALATSPINITDVLMISSSNLSLTIDYATEVLRRLELNNRIYTFACYKGFVAIAPELHHSGETAPHDRGARTLLHWFRPDEINGREIVAANSYPRPGEFNWSPYLPAREIDELSARSLM